MNLNIHKEFLALLGWEGEQQESLLPQWLRAAQLLNLTDEDVKNATRQWIPAHWDISLLGIKKCIAAIILEVIELAKIADYKAAGQKIMYTHTVASKPCISANKLAGEGRLHIFYPGLFMSIAGCALFGKKAPRVADPCMNYNCHHCTMNCVQVDAGCDGIIPAPTVTWTWGIHCNEAHKAQELLNCMAGDGWAEVFLSIPHDAALGDPESDNNFRVDYLAEQIRDNQRQISEITGVEVTIAHLRAAMDSYIDYMQRLEHLTSLVANADPQPIRGIELALLGLGMEVCFGAGADMLSDALDTTIREVEQRISAGIGLLPKGAPKLACHFQPLNIPWIEDAFLENGVNLTLGRIYTPVDWLSACVDGGDLFRSIARQCLMLPNAVNTEFAAEIISACLEKYRIDGALYGFFSFDRWVGALQKRMMRSIEEKTGVPHFYLEGEFWSSERYPMEDRISVIRSICNCMKISCIL